MNKAAIVTMAITLVLTAFLFVAIDVEDVPEEVIAEPVATENVEMAAAGSQAPDELPTTVVAEAVPETPKDPVPSPAAEINRRITKGITFDVGGNVIDKNTVEGMADFDVTVFCGGTAVFTGKNDSDGNFWFVVKNDCEPGESAWVEVDGAKSNTVTVPQNIIILGGTSNGPVAPQLSTSGADKPAGVPEFSTFTLALAVMGVGLGIAVLRRQ